MESMPHLVEMHKKYANKGLVVITVSLDAWDQKNHVKDANEFLRKLDAPFRHLLLNEPEEYYRKKLDIDGPSVYYVFDRRGKWVRFLGRDLEKEVLAKEMDKAVRQMLDEN